MIQVQPEALHGKTSIQEILEKLRLARTDRMNRVSKEISEAS